MNLINKIREFFNTNLVFDTKTQVHESDETIREALSRYCAECKKGFKNQQARDAHNRIVHEGVLRKNK